MHPDGSYSAKGYASKLGPNHPFVVWAMGPRLSSYDAVVAKHLSGEHQENLKFEKARELHRIYNAMLLAPGAGVAFEDPTNSYRERERGVADKQRAPESRGGGRSE